VRKYFGASYSKLKPTRFASLIMLYCYRNDLQTNKLNVETAPRNCCYCYCSRCLMSDITLDCLSWLSRILVTLKNPVDVQSRLIATFYFVYQRLLLQKLSLVRLVQDTPSVHWRRSRSLTLVSCHCTSEFVFDFVNYVCSLTLILSYVYPI